MHKTRNVCLSLVLLAGVAFGQEAVEEQAAPEQAATEQAAPGQAAAEQTAAEQPGAEAPGAGETPKPGGVKTLSGMSILGNEEAPTSLVIVPWKSSEIGDGIGVADSIDERARPVDKEVFLREVHYYELRSASTE